MVRISELRIRNFRSFGAGPKGLDHQIAFRGPFSFLVGENNVGKSNVLSVIREGLSYAMGGQPSLNDYHLKDTRLPVALGVTFDFDDVDYEIMERMLVVKADAPRSVIRTSLRMLFPACVVSSVHSARENTVSWRFNGRVAIKTHLSPEDSTGRSNPRSVLPLDAFVEKCGSIPEAENADAIIRKAGFDPRQTAINFERDVAGVVGNTIVPRLGVFDEVRLRPRGTGQTTLQSFDGSRVADVLHTLKNGSKEQREMYARIQQVFGDIFPDLRVEVTGPTQAPQIDVEQVATKLEVGLDRSGAGIGQVVTVLANMVNARGMVFAIDTPESNLHPHGLRTLMSFFAEVASSNQLILATHSPIVIPPERLDAVVAVRLFRGKSSVHQLSPETLTTAEKEKLRYLLGPEARELLFSRKVVFVEGDTELGALPILFKSISRDFDREGVSLIPMDGKHFAKFVKISKALGIPYSVICDRDALESIEAGVNGAHGRIPCSVILSQLFDLGLMTYGQIKAAWMKSRRRKAPASYTSETVARLLPIVRRHRIFVWPSDLEAMLESYLTQQELKDIKLETRGKVVRGRALALSLLQKGPLPPDLAKALLRIIRMRTRAPETTG